MRRPPGFTLIELLAVTGIIIVLVGMAMPLLNLARRNALKANSQSILRKLDQAIRQFRRDVDCLPYQPAYPDAVDPADPFPNNLGLRLGHNLTISEAGALSTLVATAQGKYGYPFDAANQSGVEPGPFASVLTLRYAYVPPAAYASIYGTGSNVRYWCQGLNRMGARRAEDAVLAGALDLHGGQVVDTSASPASVYKDLTADALLTSSDIGSVQTGWCSDYLLGEMPRSALSADGTGVLDAWGRPVVYVCQVVPKARVLSIRCSQRTGTGYHNQEQRVDGLPYGLGMLGFAVGTGPWSSLTAARRFSLLGSGRVVVGGADGGDGQPAPADPAGYPSTTTPWRSDRRYYAAPGMNGDFELWSAGADGTFAWMRDDPANTDNISATDYDRGLR